jgi:arginine exporter protein ArgO
VLGARIVWTGVQRYRGGPTQASVPAEVGSPARAYVGFVMLTAVNPTTVVYFLALVVGRQATDPLRDSWDVAVLFALGALLASGAWQLLLAGGGAVLGRIVTGRRGQLLIAVASGVIMLALVLHLVVGR